MFELMNVTCFGLSILVTGVLMSLVHNSKKVGDFNRPSDYTDFKGACALVFFVLLVVCFGTFVRLHSKEFFIIYFLTFFLSLAGFKAGKFILEGKNNG